MNETLGDLELNRYANHAMGYISASPRPAAGFSFFLFSVSLYIWIPKPPR